MTIRSRKDISRQQSAVGVWGSWPHRHLWADYLDKVVSSTSHNPRGLDGLLTIIAFVCQLFHLWNLPVQRLAPNQLLAVRYMRVSLCWLLKEASALDYAYEHVSLRRVWSVADVISECWWWSLRRSLSTWRNPITRHEMEWNPGGHGGHLATTKLSYDRSLFLPLDLLAIARG
jgi:hypothetical protein